MAKENNEKKMSVSKTTGLESNVAATLAYSLGLVSGILFLVVETEDKFVRFHAMQSVLANIAVIVIPTILFFTIVGIIFIPFFWIFALVLWIVLMVKAYNGESYRLPFLGNIAQRQV